MKFIRTVHIRSSNQATSKYCCLKTCGLKAEVKLNDPLLPHYACIQFFISPAIYKTSSNSSKANNLNFVNYLILNIFSTTSRETSTESTLANWFSISASMIRPC